MKVSEISPTVELSGLKFGLPHFSIKVDSTGKEITEDKLISLIEESDFYKIKLITVHCDDLANHCAEIGPFFKMLVKRGYEITLNTNCVFWDEMTFQYADFISVALKSDYDPVVFQKILRKADFKTEFKIFVSNEEDLNFAQKLYDDHFRKQMPSAGSFVNNFLQLILVPGKKGVEKDFLVSTQKRVFSTMPDVRLMPVVSFKDKIEDSKKN